MEVHGALKLGEKEGAKPTLISSFERRTRGLKPSVAVA